MPNNISSPSPSIAKDRQLVDTVAYLASLSSSTKAIDHKLDTLRFITVQWDGNSSLKEQDRAKLQQLSAWLKDYLIHHDALREFTEKTLNERVQAYLHHDTARRPRITFLSMTVIETIVALLVIAVPYTPSLATRWLFAAPAFMVVGVIGVVWFYLSSLANFKPELRRAFIYICVGTVILGLFYTHFVLVQLFDAGELPLFRYGGFVAPGAIAFVLMYRGMVVYARLLGLTSKFMSPWVFIASLAGSTVLAALIAAIRPTAQPLYFGFTFVCLFTLTVSVLFATKVTRIIDRSVSAAYAASIHWFFIFMLTTFLGSVAYEITLIILGHLSGASLGAALGSFAIPPFLLLVYTGHSFKKETSR